MVSDVLLDEVRLDDVHARVLDVAVELDVLALEASDLVEQLVGDGASAVVKDADLGF